MKDVEVQVRKVRKIEETKSGEAAGDIFYKTYCKIPGLDDAKFHFQTDEKVASQNDVLKLSELESQTTLEGDGGD